MFRFITATFVLVVSIGITFETAHAHTSWSFTGQVNDCHHYSNTKYEGAGYNASSTIKVVRACGWGRVENIHQSGYGGYYKKQVVYDQYQDGHCVYGRYKSGNRTLTKKTCGSPVTHYPSNPEQSVCITGHWVCWNGYLY